MRQHFFGALGLLVCAVACTPAADKEPVDAARASACPDDGLRLPVTNICAGRAVNYLDPAVLMTSEVLPEGCRWVVNETRMGADDEAILYQAANCKGKTTQLELRAGARSATLGYVTSGLYDTPPADFEPVRIFTTEGQANPRATILDMAKETTQNKTEAAACEIRPFNSPGSAVLADAFVVDVNDVYKKANKIAQDDLRPACGPYGFADGQRYWVIRQGYAWFVDFGQDTPDFNPNSILWMMKGADGAWTALP